MAKPPVRPAFLASAFTAAALAVWILVFVLSKKDFWAELNLFFTVVAGGWFLTLWAFLFFGWGLRGPEPSASGWTPKLQDPGWIAELLSHLPTDLDLGGDDLLGVLVALVAGFVATLLFVALLVLFWGLAELVIFLLVALVFLLVNKVFRAQVVRHRRSRGKVFRSFGLSLYLTAATVGWLPLVTLAYRLWFR